MLLEGGGRYEQKQKERNRRVDIDLGSRYPKWMTSFYVGRALRNLVVDDA